MVSGFMVFIFCVAGFLVQASVGVCAFCRRDGFKYLPAGIYLVLSGVASAGGYFSLEQFGRRSPAYAFYYYYSGAILVLLLFWVIITFYQHAFSELHIAKYIRFGAVFLLTGTALFSYVVIDRNRDHLTGRFAIELSQNLYFVGVVLTYFLWGTILKLRESSARLVQMVLALGVYFSGTAAIYAVRNMFPGFADGILAWIPPIFEFWLPLAWGYAFLVMPENSRVTTAQIAARAIA